jgi:predicted flavoprotein YhiN
LRSQIERNGCAALWLDLFPERSLDQLKTAWRRARDGESTGSRLRKRLGLDGARLALVYECLPKSAMSDPDVLLPALKALRLRLTATRPLDEAISSAGGVKREALDPGLMLSALPGVFCAGEMLDWEAPTGGYLLTACFASGLRAAEGALDWLAARD